MDLTNYIPKGDLKGIDIPIIKQMLIEQVAQGNKEDIEKLEECVECGFVWDDTKLGFGGWHKIVYLKDFTDFYKMYPKEEGKDKTERCNVCGQSIGHDIECNNQFESRIGMTSKEYNGAIKFINTKPYPKMMLVWNEEGQKPKPVKIDGKFNDKFMERLGNGHIHYTWNFAKDIEE